MLGALVENVPKQVRTTGFSLAFALTTAYTIRLDAADRPYGLQRLRFLTDVRSFARHHWALTLYRDTNRPSRATKRRGPAQWTF